MALLVDVSHVTGFEMTGHIATAGFSQSEVEGIWPVDEQSFRNQ